MTKKRWGHVLAIGLLAFACSSKDNDDGSGAGGEDPCAGALSGSCGNGCSSDAECAPGTYCGGLGVCTADCTQGGGQCMLGTCGADGRCSLGQGDGNYDGGIVDLSEEELALIDDDACAGWNAEAEPDDSILMLVVDTSGSMDRPPEGENGDTKWETTEDALRVAIDNLPASTAVGVLYYPGRSNVPESDSPRDPETCVDLDLLVPLDPLGNPQSDHRRDLDDSLRAISPGGGTPTHDAYDFALEHLRSSTLAGSKNMVLITDGQPTFSQNCVGSGLVSDPVEEQPIVDAVSKAFQQDGVRTFVIGSPGSELSWTNNDEPGEDTRPWLSRAAELGGTSVGNCTHQGEPYCHFDMSVQPDFATGLSDALAAISGSVISCNYTLPTPPAGQSLDPAAVNVVITTGSGQSQLVLRDDGSSCTEGWRYLDGGASVELCEDSCNRVLGDPQASLQLFFGCATFDDRPIR